MVPRRLTWLFDGLSIRNKVLAGYAALTIPFVTLTIFAGAMTAELLAESKRVDEDSIPTLDTLETIRTAGLTVIGQTNGLVLIRAIGADSPSSGGAVDPAAELQSARGALSLAVHDFQGLQSDGGGGDGTFRDSIQFATSDITRQSERLIRLAADRKSSAIVLQLRERFERSAASFRTLIQSAIDAERIDLTARREQLSGNIWFTAVLVVGLGLVCVLGAILGGLRVSNRIARPIQRLRDAAIRVGEGEFNVVDQRHTADEVGELVNAFQTMVERLKEMMGRLSSQERLAALGQLAGSVSHELRNPLGVLRNSLFSLREAVEGNAANTGKIIDRIERNVQRCNTIVTDLLNYARTGQPDRRDVEIDAWLSEMLDEHDLPAGITLRRELESGATVLLDATASARCSSICWTMPLRP
jgi:signal transduction histidine kinase